MKRITLLEERLCDFFLVDLLKVATPGSVVHLAMFDSMRCEQPP